MRGACNFPGITRAHFFDVLTEGNYASPAVDRLNQFMALLLQDLQSRGAPLDSEEMKLATAQIAAASLMMSLTPAIFKQSFGLDLHDDQTRQAFIERLVQRLL